MNDSPLSRIPYCFSGLRAALKCANINGKVALVLSYEDWVRLATELDNKSTSILTTATSDTFARIGTGVFTYNGFYFITVGAVLPGRAAADTFIREIDDAN